MLCEICVTQLENDDDLLPLSRLAKQIHTRFGKCFQDFSKQIEKLNTLTPNPSGFRHDLRNQILLKFEALQSEIRVIRGDNLGQVSDYCISSDCKMKILSLIS
jgi:hypothetical protein